MKKKLSFICLISLTLSGCYSARLTRLEKDVAAVKTEMNQNHEDMHSEDKKLADSVKVLTGRIEKQGYSMSAAWEEIREFGHFKMAHDKRWPHMIEKKKEAKK